MAEVGRQLGVSRQRVSMKLRHAPIQRREDGTIDMEQAKAFIISTTDSRKNSRPNGIKQAQQTIGNDAQSSLPALCESQARKEAALARLKELELGEKSAKLLNIDKGMRMVVKLANSFMQQLQSIEERLPVKIAAETDARVIRRLLKAEHAKAVALLRNGRFYS